VALRVGPIDSDGCAKCRGLAERLRARRAELRSFVDRIPSAFRYPLNPGGLLSILGLALVMRVLQVFGMLGAFLAFGVYWAFLFGVILATWKGQEALEPPDFSDVFEDLLLPAVRGVVAGAIVLVPFVFRAVTLVLGAVRERGAGGGGADAGLTVAAVVLTDPLIWLLLLASAAYLPAALLAAAVGRSVLAMLNPLVPIQVARALGSDYAVAVLVNTGLTIAGQVAGATLGKAVGQLWFVGGTLAIVPGAYFAIVAARVLGLLVHVRGDELGMGEPDDYLEPLLAGATPQGGSVNLEPAPRRPRAEDLGGPAPVAQAVAIRPQPPAEPILETVPVEPTTVPAPPGDPLEAALAAGDLARALALYKERQGAKGTLTPAQLFEIARGAAQAAEYPIAAHALHAAASAPDDPVAPDALLVLGRLYRGKLGKPDAARQAFQALVARHPGTAAAEQAKVELAKGA
jgi:hypothetical protein